jgi:hypothetical protein
MTNIVELTDKLNKARAAQKADLNTLQTMLKDKSKPLDERWDAYVALVENNVLVNNDGYGDGCIYALAHNLTLYNDFYIDKHETASYPDMYEKIMDETASENLIAARVNIDAWREEVLASGYSSFTYDW